MDKWIIKGKWDCEVDVFIVNNYGLVKYFEEYLTYSEYDYDEPDYEIWKHLLILKEHLADRLSPEGVEAGRQLLKAYLKLHEGCRDRPTSYSHSIEENVPKWTRL